MLADRYRTMRSVTGPPSPAMVAGNLAAVRSLPRRGHRGRRAGPDGAGEAAGLAVEAVGRAPPLGDRVGLDEPGVRQLAGQGVGVAERVDGIARVADDQRRVRDAAAQVERR